jgi:hypothetical protein
MRCSKCGAENPDANRFCGDCGAPFVGREEPAAVESQPGVYYCSKHKKETTRITCGRCEKPICTRCTVHGPAGVRCRDCARNRVPIRPMGVLHGAGRQLDSSAGRTVWYLALWFLVVNFFTNLFGGGDA